MDDGPPASRREDSRSKSGSGNPRASKSHVPRVDPEPQRDLENQQEPEEKNSGTCKCVIMIAIAVAILALLCLGGYLLWGLLSPKPENAGEQTLDENAQADQNAQTEQENFDGTSEIDQGNPDQNSEDDPNLDQDPVGETDQQNDQTVDGQDPAGSLSSAFWAFFDKKITIPYYNYELPGTVKHWGFAVGSLVVSYKAYSWISSLFS